MIRVPNNPNQSAFDNIGIGLVPALPDGRELILSFMEDFKVYTNRGLERAGHAVIALGAEHMARPDINNIDLIERLMEHIQGLAPTKNLSINAIASLVGHIVRCLPSELSIKEAIVFLQENKLDLHSAWDDVLVGADSLEKDIPGTLQNTLQSYLEFFCHTGQDNISGTQLPLDQTLLLGRAKQATKVLLPTLLEVKRKPRLAKLTVDILNSILIQGGCAELLPELDQAVQTSLAKIIALKRRNMSMVLALRKLFPNPNYWPDAEVQQPFDIFST